VVPDKVQLGLAPEEQKETPPLFQATTRRRIPESGGVGAGWGGVAEREEKKRVFDQRMRG